MTNKPSKPTVIQALLEAGAHFDTLNADKKAFYHMLKGQPLHEVRLPVVPYVPARVADPYSLFTDLYAHFENKFKSSLIHGTVFV
jgi:hypothetical protein